MPSSAGPDAVASDRIDRRDLLTGLVGVGMALSAEPAAAARAPSRSGAARGLRMAYADGPWGQIHYRQVAPARAPASPLPLLCLHASPLSGLVYDQWLLEIGRDRIAVAPDTPGYGSSAAPTARPEIGDYADAMLGFMDELGLRQVDVMGYHTGALTSVELARRHPERVRHVVMISAPIFTPAELAMLRASSGTPVPSFEVALSRLLENWRRDGKGMFRDATEDRVIDMRLESLRRFRTASWGFQAAFDYDLAATLPQLRQPVLVLNPEDDLWTMTPRARPLLNARSRIHDLPGWTHGHLDAHTAAMARIVREFVDA